MLHHVIDRLIGRALHFNEMHKRGRPGELVSSLPPEEREALKKAKAEDFNHEMMFERTDKWARKPNTKRV